MNDFDRLKHLLLEAEQRRLDGLEQGRAQLSDDLPKLIGQAQQDHPVALAAALAHPVAEALGGAVQARKQQLVDALFPVIMPAIRRSIAEYLRAVSQDLNQIFESSLTWRGLKWRLEARRLGVSYATVALRHSLLYQVDHLFLIQRESGLILDRESVAGLPDLDADAVAGMLTAIGDFVRDSVGAGEAELSSATVGEHLLWVLRGPRANLAALIRGVPPESLKQELIVRLERVHEQYGDQLGVGPEELGSLPGLKEALTPSDLKAIRAEAQVEPSLRPVMLATIGITVLVLAAGVLIWQWQQRVANLVAGLDQTPGLEVTDVSSLPWWSISLQVLRDPLAPVVLPLVQSRLPEHVGVSVREQAIVSAEPAMVLERMRRRLDLPESLTSNITSDRLVLTGTVSPELWRALHSRAQDLAGGVVLDLTGVQADWPAALASLGPWPKDVTASSDGIRTSLSGVASHSWIESVRVLHGRQGWSDLLDLSQLVADRSEELARINRTLRGKSVSFDQGEAGDGLGLDTLADHLAGLLPALESGGLRVRVVCLGLSDPSGAETDNRRLERERAEWLCRGLSARLGNRPDSLWQLVEAPLDLATLRQRAALVQLEWIDPP
ncbi:MAG: hypothetical protein IPK97_09440 [Ahniella sp.]|nr:hypothetical protein [Ahniella sp.]